MPIAVRIIGILAICLCRTYANMYETHDFMESSKKQCDANDAAHWLNTDWLKTWLEQERERQLSQAEKAEA